MQQSNRLSPTVFLGIVLLGTLAWLGLISLPLEGPSVLLAAAIHGVTLALVLREWWVGLFAGLVAVLGDVLALAAGTFAFLGEFWYFLPIVSAMFASLTGMLLYRWSQR